MRVECMKLAIFIAPRTISMSPTESSMESPIRAGITTSNRMMAEPTTNIVRVWPIPQKMPVSAAFSRLRWRLTIVVTATTWSGSVAWRIPRKNPTAIIDRKLIMTCDTLSDYRGHS